MFDKVIKIGMLYDFYGQLLTDKQREVMHLYYEDDYSLGEIAENLNISRQAVYDTLKKSEKILLEFEEQLKLFDKFKESEYVHKKIIDKIDLLLESYKEDEYLTDQLNKMKEILQENI